MAATMRVRVVGSSASVPRPGRACSCHLIRTREANVLLDMGTGALANLREVMDYPDLDAIVISHMHADHFLDLIPLRYGLKYGPLLREERLPLWLPPGGEQQLRALAATFSPEGPKDFLDEVFEITEYDPKGEVYVGNLTISFAKTIHYIDAYAVRVERDGASVCYSSDTAPCDAVEELAHGCNLFLCEASLGLAQENGEMRGHLSAVEAGQMAQRAGARRLVLTHYGTEFAPGELEDAARSTYRGPCAAADDGTELTI
ncbi:MAG: MBL fold metallo-hydrolase [bacterium]|nr:MBL fold metallo-hydrolase [bacterium]